MLPYAHSTQLEFDDRTWVPSRRSILIVGAAIVTVMVLLIWSNDGIRSALARERPPYLNLMPNQAFYERYYIWLPIKAGTIVHAVLGAIVCVQVTRRRWASQSLLMLIWLFLTWFILVAGVLMIESGAMT